MTEKLNFQRIIFTEQWYPNPSNAPDYKADVEVALEINYQTKTYTISPKQNKKNEVTFAFLGNTIDKKNYWGAILDCMQAANKRGAELLQEAENVKPF